LKGLIEEEKKKIHTQDSTKFVETENTEVKRQSENIGEQEQKKGDEQITEENNVEFDKAGLVINVEEEEHFLRDLGWVPEEEAHVPVLSEEEIREVQAILQKIASKDKNKLSLDSSIKRWQHEKYSVPIFTSIATNFA